jgi:hypothetical protein
MPTKTRTLDWGSKRDQESVTRALHRQGQLWRAILSGERDCLGFLSTDDYLRVADQLLGDIRQLAVRFVRQFWLITTALVILVIATITAVFVFHAATALIAAVVTTAGAVGITWKGAASSLGRVLQQAQRPLWETELDAAIAVKATQMPRELRSAQRPGDSDRLGQEAEVPAATAPPATD